MDKGFKVLGIIIALASVRSLLLPDSYHEFALILMILIIALGCIVFGIGHIISLMNKNK